MLFSTDPVPPSAKRVSGPAETVVVGCVRGTPWETSCFSHHQLVAIAIPVAGLPDEDASAGQWPALATKAGAAHAVSSFRRSWDEWDGNSVFGLAVADSSLWGDSKGEKEGEGESWVRSHLSFSFST